MPNGGMNSFNAMEHAQAQARKAMEAAQQAQTPQGGTNDATLAAQQQAAQTQPVDQAAAVPMQQAGMMPGMAQPGMAQQPQEGPEDLIDAVQDGTATDMKGKPFVNTLKSAKEAFAQMLQQAEAGETPESTPSMQDNPALTAVEQPETIEPGDGEKAVPAENQAPDVSPAPAEQRSIEEMISAAVQKVLGQNGPAESEAQSEEQNPEAADEIVIPDINSDEFYEQFTENPGEAIQKIADAMSEKKLREFKAQIQPLIEQSDQLRNQQKATEAIRKFAENGYDDFQDYKDDIVRFMQERGLAIDDPANYESAYNFSKARRLQAENDGLRQQNSKTLDDYLNDSDSLNKMSANEQVKRMVIEQYLKSLQDGQSPQIITGGANNSPNATPKNEIGSIKEATRLFRQSFNQ